MTWLFFCAPVLLVPDKLTTYAPFASIVVSKVARVAPGGPLVVAASTRTSEGVSTGQYVSDPEASVTLDESTIGTRSVTDVRCAGDAIQPCATTGAPLAVSSHVSETELELSCVVAPNAVACRTSVPARLP